MMATTALTLDDILTRYQAETLAEEDDATLYEAMAILEKADKAFLNEAGQLSAPLDLIAIEQRAALTRVAEAIYEILLVRYGCND